MIDKLTHIENKICQLKQKKDRIQTQHAIFLMKEAQKILKEEFSPEAALNILKDNWNAASPSQKEDWKKRDAPFPLPPTEPLKKTETRNPTSQQSTKAEVPHHEHP
jgi:hypothetical protein